MTHPFSRLFTFDAWATRATLESLVAMDAPPQAAVRWIAHVVGAQEVWWGRMQDPLVPAEVWPEMELDETADRHERMVARWAGLLAAAEPAVALDGTLHYANTRGERLSTPVADVLTHVVLHGMHHRGQIAAAVRAAGGTPAATDFVHASRIGMLD